MKDVKSVSFGRVVEKQTHSINDGKDSRQSEDFLNLRRARLIRSASVKDQMTHREFVAHYLHIENSKVLVNEDLKYPEGRSQLINTVKNLDPIRLVKPYAGTKIERLIIKAINSEWFTQKELENLCIYSKSGLNPKINFDLEEPCRKRRRV